MRGDQLVSPLKPSGDDGGSPTAMRSIGRGNDRGRLPPGGIAIDAKEHLHVGKAQLSPLTELRFREHTPCELLSHSDGLGALQLPLNGQRRIMKVEMPNDDRGGAAKGQGDPVTPISPGSKDGDGGSVPKRSSQAPLDRKATPRKRLDDRAKEAPLHAELNAPPHGSAPREPLQLHGGSPLLQTVAEH